MRLRLAIFSAMITLLIAAPAAAQETPYSPLKVQPTELINFPGYDRSPLVLEFPELRRERVLSGKRLDFKHVYAKPYGEMIQYFVDAYHNKTKIQVIDPDVVPFTDSAEMNLLGIQENNTPARFTLGHPRIPGMIAIDVVPEGSGSAIIVQNVIWARIYSGVMPIRSDYQPRGAKPLPFRWN